MLPVAADCTGRECFSYLHSGNYCLSGWAGFGFGLSCNSAAYQKGLADLRIFTQLLFLWATAGSIIIGLQVYLKNRQARLNRAFSLVCLGMTYWSFVLAQIYSSPGMTEAEFWLKSAFLWPLVPSITLYFVLIYTGYDRYPGKKLSALLVYLPAIAFIGYVQLRGGYAIDENLRYFGWTYKLISPAIGTVGASLVMGMNALGVVCIYHFYTRQREKYKKRQSLLMLLGISTPLLVEIISHGLFPGLGLELPELTPIGFVIGTVGFMGYAIWRYGVYDVSAREVAERKNAESALNMRDAEFRALVEHSSDLIVRFDTRQRLTFCNSAFLERYNLTWHNVSGKTCAGAGLPAKLARTWSESLLEVMNTGVEKSIDLREKSSDGYDYFNVRFTPELDENGSVASVLTVARDISEHIRTEIALRQTENRYHLIFNQSVDVLVHLGGSAIILDLNQRALDLTGLRREELVGKRISSLSGLFTKTSLARMVKAFSIRKMGMEVKPYEVEAKTPDGRRLFFEITGTPLIDDNGKNIGEISVMRDITASKKDQEQAIEKSRALSVRNQELTGLVEISTVLGHTLDIEELLERTLEKLTGMSVLGIKPEGGIFLLEGDRLRLAAAKNVSETFRQQHLDLRIGQCLCGLVAQEGEMVICTNNVNDDRHTIHHDGMQPHGDIILPLKAFDRIAGVMFLHTEPNIELGERKLELLRSIGSQLGMAINNAMLFEEAREQSLHDPLTGLANRSLMDVELDKSLARCRRSGEPLSLLMLDLDFFKRFNDTYGHGAGDDLLVALARILEQEIREVDLIVRYGGEEFLVIMPDTASEVAVTTADRIRKVVESTVFPAGDGRQANITVSIGVATSVDGSESQAILMVRADTALYLAKERGRNRVEQWVESHV